MSPESLIYPMFVLVVWSFLTVLRLFLARVSSLRAGEGNVRYYLTYQDGREPDHVAQLSRSFINLFEAPVLFYAGCITAIALGQVSQVLVILAWAYAAIRIVHSLIHTGGNQLRARVGVYFLSWAVLVALWCVVVLNTL